MGLVDRVLGQVRRSHAGIGFGDSDSAAFSPGGLRVVPAARTLLDAADLDGIAHRHQVLGREAGRAEGLKEGRRLGIGVAEARRDVLLAETVQEVQARLGEMLRSLGEDGPSDRLSRSELRARARRDVVKLGGDLLTLLQRVKAGEVDVS